MGASEQLMEAVTVSGGGVTLQKEFVEDDYTVPTIQFVVENDADDVRTVGIAESIPADYSADAIGFHPEYGAEHWTGGDDDQAEFERDLDAGEEYTTVYGLKIDDTDEADAFLTEPTLAVDGEVVGEADVVEEESSDDAESGTDPVTGEDGTTADEDVAVDDGATADDEGPDSVSLDVEIPDEATNGARDETRDVTVSETSASGPSVEASAVPGPETGSVVERLVEELRRNDVDSEQKAILRDQLDLGVPSETKARIEQLSNRVETVGAYADALEEFLDDEGTAQEVIDDFETQVSALREDVASIREQTGSNASEIGSLTDDLGTLETEVDDLEATLADVGDQADDIEDSLSTTDSQLENVESDLRQAEEQIETNVDDIDELDTDLSDVEGDLSDVEDRVTETEGDVETLDEAAADLRTDVDDLETDVEDLEGTTAAHAEDIESVEAYAEELDEDIGAVEDDVEDILAWRDELGEMFQ